MNTTVTAVKNHANYAQQIQKLIEKNLEITDVTAAVSYLKKVNFYRFSGYMRFFSR